MAISNNHSEPRKQTATQFSWTKQLPFARRKAPSNSASLGSCEDFELNGGFLPKAGPRGCNCSLSSVLGSRWPQVSEPLT